MRALATRVCVLVGAAVLRPSVAPAQALEARWIRAGVFATRDAGLAPSVEVRDPIAVDLDRDGVDDALLTLARPDDEGQALVVARHERAGWRLSCVDCEAVGGVSWWSQAVVGPDGVMAVRVHEGRNDGAENVNERLLYWFTPGAAPVEVYESSGGLAFDTLSRRPDGTFLAATGGPSPRFQLLRWNRAHTRLQGDRVRRTAPDAPSPAASPSSVPTPSGAGCTATPRASVHLRPTESAASQGPELAAQTPLAVLNAATLVRGTTRMYRVRVVSSGAEGFVFLARDELGSGCAR